MRAPLVIGILGVAGLLSSAPASAAPLDGSVPMLCALNAVVECARRGECERSNPEDAQVPPLVRIDVPKKVLSTVDGARTSPITTINRSAGRLMIQGMQNERVWGAVVNEQTGQMSATVSETDGSIVITGACVAP
jgi:hypothetical protein